MVRVAFDWLVTSNTVDFFAVTVPVWSPLLVLM